MLSDLRHYRQRGLTLVELLVAMAVGLLIVLAAVSALIVSRQGFTTVDASSQLRDNARFAADIVQRIALQAGFKDSSYVINPPTAAELIADASGLIPANVTGFHNALAKKDDLTQATARAPGTVGYGSDVLILRYQTAKLNNDASSIADNAVIDCAGQVISTMPADRNDRMVSAFYVNVSKSGEPSLMCARSPNGLAPFSVQPLVQGVELFKVLYGVDGFTKVNQPFTAAADSVPEKYLRADQIMVSGDPASKATYDNWRRVRSIRIGMVLRGPPNSQQDRSTQTFYPFGLAKASPNAAPGSAFASDDNVNSAFTPAADGRLRQVVTFTIHLRNDQGL